MKIPRSVVYFGWLILCVVFIFVFFLDAIAWYLEPIESTELICQQIFSYQDDAAFAGELARYDCWTEQK